MSGMHANERDISARPCPFGGEWQISRRLGSGSYGIVYLIEREDAGEKIQSAMKWIPIPDSDSAPELLVRQGVARQQIPAYYDEIADALRGEITLMSKLRGNSHIVSYEDHRIIKRAGGVGTDIYIRMEYLTPLDAYLSGRALRYGDVARLGAELCEALITCAQYDIIHRDIKPDNIFVSHDGNFKLGDFGIAQRLDRLPGEGRSRAGSLGYMAPEVYRGEAYDGRADLYSIGMVLYRLLNERRAPFLPLPPEDYSGAQESAARDRRFAGEALTPPCHALEPLWWVIQKACMFNPESRYASAKEMRDALLAICRLPEADVPLALAPAAARVDAGDRTSKRTPSAAREGTDRRKNEAASALSRGTGASAPLARAPASAPAAKPRAAGKIKLLAVLLTLAAAAIVLALVLRPGKKTPEAVRAALLPRVEEALATSLALSWQDTAAPYDIAVFCGDTPVAALSCAQPTITLAELAPHTAYTVTVTDRDKITASLACKTAECALYDARPFRLHTMYVAQYERLALEENALSALVAMEKTKPLAEGELVLRNANVRAQTLGWLWMALLDKTQPQADADTLLVLRLDNGAAFAQSVPVTLADGLRLYYWPLDELLARAYDALSGWPSGGAALEYYTDGRFVAEIPLRFNAARADGQ